MVERRLHLAVLVFLQLTQGLTAQEVRVQVKPFAAAYSNNVPMVNRGENFSFLCNIMKNGAILEENLVLCQFWLPSESKRILLYPNATLGKGMKYIGRGLDKGDCGLQIPQVQEEHNGNIDCFLQAPSTPDGELAGHTKLIVTIPPHNVSMAVWNPEDQRSPAVLKANCTVHGARPRANITWFLGNDQIAEGLMDPVEYEGPSETTTLQQNLTLTLQNQDDEKMLRCVAEHYGLKEGSIEDQYMIQVNFAPKQAEEPFEKFDVKEGEVVRIPFTVEAKPKPKIYWTIDNTVISENETKGRYRVETTQLKGPGKYETVLVIDTLIAADTDVRYIVTASNKFGEKNYTVKVSSGSKPEPPEEMATGLIVSVVIAVVLILLVLAGVYYARAKGKFCFAVVDAEKNDTPSEGMENPAVNHNSSSEYIKNSPELKKDKPKEDTPV